MSSQGVLAALALVGGGAGGGRARPGALCELGFPSAPLCLVTSPPCGVGRVPGYWSRSPEG